jgi:hypothetical protein
MAPQISLALRHFLRGRQDDRDGRATCWLSPRRLGIAVPEHGVRRQCFDFYGKTLQGQ